MSATTASGLLLRLRNPQDQQAWQTLLTLYQPLLHQWMRKFALRAADADDLVQEVLQTVAREMPSFQYDRAKGSFRGWLRTILVHRIRHFQRSHRARFPAQGQEVLEHLASPSSALSAHWNREHDEYVLRQLLRMAETEFTPTTWQAFLAVAIEKESPVQAAERLGMTVNAVRIAKSRVLQRLQQCASELGLDTEMTVDDPKK